MGLFNINKDKFETAEEVRAQIYHLAWHAIDLYKIRQEPAYRRKFKSGPMVPKRSALNLCKANLQADVFALTLSSLREEEEDSDTGDQNGEGGNGEGGGGNMLTLITKKRGEQSLTPLSGHRAEDFSSIIAIESCLFALKELESALPAKEGELQAAQKLSLEVGHTFDENNIRQWWDFSIPAQDMAWRGFKKEEILGAAVNTSEDPFVRSMGYLVQEATGIEPTPASALTYSYNAFVHPDANLDLHHEMVDTVFEEAIQQGVVESSSQAFLNAANKQNEDLTEGRILGWCASALQEAARAFEKALHSGAPPEQAARMQFESNKEIPKWDALKDLSDNIVDQRRQGFAVTMGHIAEICHNHPAFAPVLSALKITMNDPNYIQKLEASNDLAVQPFVAPKGPAPSGLEFNAPAPKGLKLDGPAPTEPAMPIPAAGPTLGGKSNRTAQINRQRQLAARKQQQQKQQEDSGDTTQQ